MFSPAVDAPALLHSRARVHWRGGQPQIAQWHSSTVPIELSAASAEPLDRSAESESRAAGGTSGMGFTLVSQRLQAADSSAARAIHLLPRRTPAKPDANWLYLTVASRCEPQRGLLYEWFGPMGFSGLMVFDPAGRTLEFSGHVSRFPAFEMYAAINEGAVQPVFRLSPPRGANLFARRGAADRPVRGFAALGLIR
jgi:hypothetical protein